MPADAVRRRGHRRRDRDHAGRPGPDPVRRDRARRRVPLRRPDHRADPGRGRRRRDVRERRRASGSTSWSAPTACTPGCGALAFGPRAGVRAATSAAYTAYFTVPDPGDLDNWFLMYNAPGGRVAGIRPERGGTAKARLSFASPQPATTGWTAPAEAAARRAIRRGRLAGRRRCWPRCRDAPDFYFDAISQVQVEQWSRGRVVLLGDAGYCGSPLAGLGTSIGLVGAYVLAGELAAAGRPRRRRSPRYQEEMADYVAECQRTAARWRRRCSRPKRPAR